MHRVVPNRHGQRPTTCHTVGVPTCMQSPNGRTESFMNNRNKKRKISLTKHSSYSHTQPNARIASLHSESKQNSHQPFIEPFIRRRNQNIHTMELSHIDRYVAMHSNRPQFVTTNPNSCKHSNNRPAFNSFAHMHDAPKSRNKDETRSLMHLSRGMTIHPFHETQQ